MHLLHGGNCQVLIAFIGLSEEKNRRKKQKKKTEEYVTKCLLSNLFGLLSRRHSTKENGT